MAFWKQLFWLLWLRSLMALVVHEFVYALLNFHCRLPDISAVRGSCVRQFWLLGMYIWCHFLIASVLIWTSPLGIKIHSICIKLSYVISYLFPCCLVKCKSRLQILMKNLLLLCFIKVLVRWCLGWVQVK